MVSPLIAGSVAYLLFRTVQFLIPDTDDRLANARRFVPGYIFLTGFTIGLITLTKGLKHVGLALSTGQGLAIALGVASAITGVALFFIRRIEPRSDENADFHFSTVERVFAVMMVVTACSMAFAHGSNDVANAVGPVAAVVAIVSAGGDVTAQTAIPAWVLLIGAGGIVSGLVMWGYRVIGTVGRGITELTPKPWLRL